jgi:hypothetical protein
MKIKLIIGSVGLFVCLCVTLWSLWLVLFKKPPVKPQFKKYFWRMTLGMAAYVLGIAVMNHFYTPQSPYKYWLILLPILPLIFVCFAIVRAVVEMDEMKRKIATESMAFTGLATGFTCFSYLFLRDMGAPEFRPEWAFYIMWIYYGIGAFFSWRRYK